MRQTSSPAAALEPPGLSHVAPVVMGPEGSTVPGPADMVYQVLVLVMYKHPGSCYYRLQRLPTCTPGGNAGPIKTHFEAGVAATPPKGHPYWYLNSIT